MKKNRTIESSETLEARKKLSLQISNNKPSQCYTTNQWIEMAKQVAPQYNYSNVEYKGKDCKVEIICEKHGSFSVNPKYFLWDKYDYSITQYKGYEEYCEVICHKKDENGNEHGIFLVRPHGHLSKELKIGCPKCAKENISFRVTSQEFI